MSNSHHLNNKKLEFAEYDYLKPLLSGDDNVFMLNQNLNNLSFLNKTLFEIYKQSEINQILIFKFETSKGRISTNLKKHFLLIAYLKITFDFLFYRFLGKIILVDKLVNRISNHKNVVLSKAEGLGRLVYCGFEIIDDFNIENLVYVKVKKTCEYEFQLKNKEPRYGFIIKMPRIGKNGEKINVFKIRTMHPYAEYIHGYILKSNGYNNKGKPANDYRITVWGKYLRKYWIDEIPQFWNLLKGDMKIVGIRPVSAQYLSDIPENFRNRRLKYKPGCIPPYLSYNIGTTKESVVLAEELYMNKFDENPLKTDILVFLRAIFNILIKNKRSA